MGEFPDAVLDALRQPLEEGVVRISRARYARRLSGPLLDRFDLVVPLQRPDPVELLSVAPGESTLVVADRVAVARRMAESRGVACNALMPSAVPASTGRWVASR